MADKKCIQLDFGPDSASRLDRLKELTEAASCAEVVANALKLYEGVIDEGGHGARLVVQKDYGTANAQWYWDAYRLGRTYWWWRYILQPNYHWGMKHYQEEIAAANQLDAGGTDGS